MRNGNWTFYLGIRNTERSGEEEEEEEEVKRKKVGIWRRKVKRHLMEILINK